MIDRSKRPEQLCCVSQADLHPIQMGAVEEICHLDFTSLFPQGISDFAQNWNLPKSMLGSVNLIQN